MDTTSILISLYHPFPRTLSLSLPSSSPISSITSLLSRYCPAPSQLVQYSSGRSLPSPTLPISSLSSSSNSRNAPIFLRLSVKLPGGKGGFASQLRAQGGRMSSNKAQNHDSCRGLDGRRLSTIKEAQRLAKVLESEPDRQAARAKQAQEKLDQLNHEIRQLERAAGVESSSETGPVASGSTSGGDPAAGPSMGTAGGGGGAKRRLDDTKYVDESREIVSGVKDAVRAAMMKKRKKTAKPAEEPTASTSTEKEQENATLVTGSEEKDEVVGEANEQEEGIAETTNAKGKGKATAGKGKGKAKA